MLSFRDWSGTFLFVLLGRFFLWTPSVFFRLEYPLSVHLPELVQDGIKTELSMHLVVSGAHIHGTIDHLLFTNHCNIEQCMSYLYGVRNTNQR